MTNDQKTSIAGLISAIGLVIAAFFPQVGTTVQSICSAISAIAIGAMGYYTNKPDTGGLK